jgi:transcriptional regulator with GAF, ATPase, and Fis domain
VAEILLVCSAKRLRALQERKFERIGGDRTVKVDVPVVAATNLDVKAATRARGFFGDPCYR